MNTKNICVFDFETDGTNPHQCNPVQLAATIIHPVKLDFVEGATFCSYMKPPGINEPDYIKDHKSTIDWHAKTRNCTAEEILATWKKAPEQKDVWTSFTSWLGKYHTRQDRQGIFTAPIAAGYNILNFDMPIINRLCTKYGDIQADGAAKIFFPRDKIDLMNIAFWWFEGQGEPANYTMDTLRDYFGMSKENAHDALQDVKDEGYLLCRLLKTQRWLTTTLLEQNKLKKAFKGAIYG